MKMENSLYLQSRDNLVDAIKKVQIPDDHKLVSFDNKSHYQLPLPTDELMDLLHLCLTSTYFQYNGKHYKQLHGTAMGSPVSVVVAEIVMQNIGTGPRKLH